MSNKNAPVDGKEMPRQAAGGGRRRLESHALLGHSNELIIVHGTEEYHLRLTRQGKLILTK